MVIKSNRVGRQRILDVAEELFTERGYRAVSIRDIAQACEVSNAALYYHFSSKEALFNEVVDHHAVSLSARMSQAAQSVDSARKKVEAILAEYAWVTAERRSPLFLLRREAKSMDKPQSREQFRRLIHAMLRPLEEVLSEAMESGELRSVPDDYSPAALLVGMMHGLMQHKRTCQSRDISEEDISFVVDIFWDGLGA